MIIEKACAKINLFLRIDGKRPDGYHDLTSVMQSVSLYDTVLLKKRKDSLVTFRCGVDELCSENNLCVKAAKMYSGELGTCGCDIRLIKRIPWNAGLGGGSSDCAAVLRGMNRLYGRRASADELERMGAKLGADVPFLINGGTALANGIGEILTPVKRLSHAYVTVIEGSGKTSTSDAYSQIDRLRSEEPFATEKKDVKPLINAIEHNDLKNVGRLLFNDFEILYERDKRYEICGEAEGVCLTGSGSAVFALFNSRRKASKAAKLAEEEGYAAHVCKTI